MFACQYVDNGVPVTTHHASEQAAEEAAAAVAKGTCVVIFEVPEEAEGA